MPSPADEFRRELATLRDGLVEAIDRSAYGQVSAGLDLYASLLRSVLRSHGPLEETLRVRPSTWRNSYGRVMEWLEADLRLFADRLLAAGSATQIREFLRALNDMLDDCVEEDEPDAHRSILGVFEAVWADGPTRLDAQAWELVRGGLLALLTSHLEYRLGPAAERQEPVANGAFVRQIFTVLAFLARKSIDTHFRHAAERGSPPSPSDWPRNNVEASVHALRDLFGSLERTEDKDIAAGARRLILLRDVYALGLEAYVLTRYRMDRSTREETAELFGIVSKGSAAREGWIAYWHSLERGELGDLGFSWWELDLFEGPEKGGFLGFESDLTTAFAIRLLAGTVDPVPPVEDLRKMASRHSTQYFLERVLDQGLASDRLEDTLQTLGRSRPTAIGPQDHIADAIEALKREGAELLAALPLDSVRVEAFVTGVQSAWAPKSVFHLLGSEASIYDDPTPQAERTVFGSHVLVPKEYFVETHVHADPSDLGEQYGRSIARGEVELAIAALNEIAAAETADEPLADQVESAVDLLRDSGFEPTVVILNSWRARTTLVGNTGTRDPEGRCGMFAGVEVYYQHSRGSEQVLVGDFGACLRLRRLPLRPRDDWERLATDDRLTVGVREIDGSRAKEMIDRDQEFRRGDSGRWLSNDAASLALRQKVETKAHSRPEWELHDTTGIVRLQVH